MTTLRFKLDYRYWDIGKGMWRHRRLFFSCPEDAEEFVTDEGLSLAVNKYTIKEVSPCR